MTLGVIPPGWNVCARHGDAFPPTQQACQTCFAERRLALKLAALRVGLHRDKPTRRKIRKCKVDVCTMYITGRRKYCREHVEQMRMAAIVKSQSVQAAKRRAERREQMRVWVLLGGIKVRLAEASRALGVSVPTISRALKTGRSRMVTIDEHRNIEKSHGSQKRKTG